MTGGSATEPSRRVPLGELARVFLRLGTTAFGGPAVHVAMMEEEFVRGSHWLTPERFLDLLGTANLIPGPSSTELALYLGYELAGAPGLMVAGACFILPAARIVFGLAWAYVRFGSLPIAAGLLDGIKPVVLAVVLQALWNLGRTVVKSSLAVFVALAVIVLYLRGLHELVLLSGGGLGFVAMRALRQPESSLRGIVLPLLFTAQATFAGVNEGLGRLFVAMLKVGATLYGSGYVLLAFLHNDFVVRAHWITDRQLLDAVAVGQFTPGPVFTTATFLGYLVAGSSGAVVATVGIFLPSFVLVALTGRWLPHLRTLPVLRTFLDGVNVSALGLMAAVTIDLAGDALLRARRPDWAAMALFAGSALALIRWKVNATPLMLGGAVLGGLQRGLR